MAIRQGLRARNWKEATRTTRRPSSRPTRWRTSAGPQPPPTTSRRHSGRGGSTSQENSKWADRDMRHTSMTTHTQLHNEQSETDRQMPQRWRARRSAVKNHTQRHQNSLDHVPDRPRPRCQRSPPTAWTAASSCAPARARDGWAGSLTSPCLWQSVGLAEEERDQRVRGGFCHTIRMVGDGEQVQAVQVRLGDQLDRLSRRGGVRPFAPPSTRTRTRTDKLGWA